MNPVIQSVLLVATVLAIVVPAPAQDVPPRPVDDLVAAFVNDPMGSRFVAEYASKCTATGGWRRELLERLLALPYDRVRFAMLMPYFSWAVETCNIDPLDAWARSVLEEHPAEDGIPLMEIARNLYRSGREVNVASARAAVFSRRFSDRLRSGIASRIVMGPDADVAKALAFMATGYREHGTAPPAFLSTLLFIARARGDGDEALAAKQQLLAALLSRADGDGAAVMMNIIMSSALPFDVNDPWHREVGRTVNAIMRSEIDVPIELRRFVTPRAIRYNLQRDTSQVKTRLRESGCSGLAQK